MLSKYTIVIGVWLPLTIGMRDCLAKSCNPFSLICTSCLCHKYGETSSSTTFSWLSHTFTCVLYNKQHNLPYTTTKDSLVSFQLLLPIKWLYPSLSSIHIEIRFKRRHRKCHTFLNVNVYLVLVCVQMSPISTIWETLVFLIFTTSKSLTLYMEKYSIFNIVVWCCWATIHSSSWSATWKQSSWL